MPQRLNKPCSYPGCPELIEAGDTYCEKHRAKANRQRNKRYDQKRDPKLKKFYSSSRWRKLRNLKLKRDPICEMCEEKNRTRMATEVDHIIPIKVDWEKRLRLDNLQSLCHGCHMKKTQEDKNKFNL